MRWSFARCRPEANMCTHHHLAVVSAILPNFTELCSSGAQVMAMTANPIRLFISVACVCLSACAGSVDQLASTDLDEDKENKKLEQLDTCAKLGELQIGMMTSQVLLACGRRPLRTSDLITRDGKKVTIWAYGNGTLNMTDDKLVRIFSLNNDQLHSGIGTR